MGGYDLVHRELTGDRNSQKNYVVKVWPAKENT